MVIQCAFFSIFNTERKYCFKHNDNPRVFHMRSHLDIFCVLHLIILHWHRHHPPDCIFLCLSHFSIRSRLSLLRSLRLSSDAHGGKEAFLALQMSTYRFVATLVSFLFVSVVLGFCWCLTNGFYRSALKWFLTGDTFTEPVVWFTAI